MTIPVTELLVHEEAIRSNTEHFVALTGGRVMAVLKADAFGHGEIARTVLAAGASSIGVATIREALAVRAAGIQAPLLSWLNTVDADVEAALATGIELAAPSPELLHAIARAARRTRVTARVHLHVDVGMARDGCPPGEWAGLCELARSFEAAGSIQVVGVMGHLSCADEPADPQNLRERLHFDNAVRAARRRGLNPRVRHLAATAATLTGAAPGLEMHRIGAGLFGIDPSHTSDALRPALSLTSRVVSSRTVPAGTGIGYGLDHIVDRRTNLALLPVGYGDGIPRGASGRAHVLARGHQRPLVGRISMDMIVVDTGDDRLAPGEPVVLFGPGVNGEPTVADWASWADTIEHEIVTRLGSRGTRIHRRLTFDPVLQEAPA